MEALVDLLKGLGVTFKELFRKSVTDKYPKEFIQTRTLSRKACT